MVLQGHDHKNKVMLQDRSIMKYMRSENSRMNKIFSKKKTKHGMDLRKYEKIQVRFAKKKADSKTLQYHICKESSTQKI